MLGCLQFLHSSGDNFLLCYMPMYRPSTWHKYNAKPQDIDGHYFASKREAAVYKDLKLFVKQGEITDLQLQPTIELLPKPNRIAYRADFRVTWKNGSIEYIDVKGMETATFKLKHKLLKHLRPDIVLIIMR